MDFLHNKDGRKESRARAPGTLPSGHYILEDIRGGARKTGAKNCGCFNMTIALA
jgi:hypothetical protein